MRVNNTFFSVENVIREYVIGSKVKRTLRVLDQVDLQIEEGEILVILGQSGAGKSTLLHIMGLLDHPTTGKVLHRGLDLSSLSNAEQAQYRNLVIGFVFQFYHLLPEFTALENVLMPQLIRHGFWPWLRKGQPRTEKAKETLMRVGLGERLIHRPVELSGGERQRVAIARALVNDPQIVLCDEPTGNLDEQNAKEIQKLIWDLNRQLKQTFVIVTHDEGMAREAHRVFRMQTGKLHSVSRASLFLKDEEKRKN